MAVSADFDERSSCEDVGVSDSEVDEDENVGTISSMILKMKCEHITG